MITGKYARRMASIRGSDIRELLKLTENRDVISMGGGLPAPELFPVEELRGAADRLLTRSGRIALQYSSTEGYAPLRGRIAERMNLRWGTHLGGDQILMTTGSQQGLDLIGKLFLDEGDAVICESPTYIGAITAWNVFCPEWVEVQTDDEGMRIEHLEERLDARPDAKLIYIVPNFQNPSGRTWSIERRWRLMELAVRRGIPVVEDNPYGEVRFEGEHLPALMSMDEKGLVVGLGTYSKVFAPGLRLGWVAAEPGTLGKLTLLKQGADLHTGTFDQMLAFEYLEKADLDERIGQIIETYRARRDAMIRALEREMPAEVRFTRPAGGLFLWVELPAGIDARLLLRRCLDEGVAFVPGSGFFPNGGHENTMRLNFSNASPERIEEGIRRLARALGELTKGSGAIDAAVAQADPSPGR